MATPWQEVLDSAPDAMLLVEADGRIRMVNRQLEAMFGYGRDELVGQQVELLVPEEFRRVHRGHRAAFGSSPHVRQMGHGFTLYGRRRDGTQLPVEISLSPLHTDEGIVVSAAVRDATERVETERRLRELDRLKDEFLSVVSHELRTPLTAITGFAQLLLTRGGDIDDAGRQDMLVRIARNASEMDRLVGQLLDLSRLDAGHIELAIERVDLADALTSCLSSLATPVAARVEADVPGGLAVAADRHALDRVLSNLVTNAVKFSPEDRPVRVDARPNGDGHVVVSVADEGVGIPPEEHERVFDRFYQLDPDQRGPRHGTGIGLSIVRRYVELLDGRVWIESELGSGSRFSFTLPAA